MREITRVAQAVSDLLSSGELGEADRPVVMAYIGWRQAAAERLAAFGAALDEGEDHRALQISEAEPPLPDFVAHLSLVTHLNVQTLKGRTEEQLWEAYCSRHGLPVPPPLDSMAVQRLHDRYRQGITTDSPFYRDCLAAMSAGDEAKALVLIRSIVRLSQDPAAKAHMDLMLRRRAGAQLASLRACLEQGHEAGVIGWLDEFERSGADGLLLDEPIYQAALAARKAIMSRRTTAEAVAILSAAAAQAQREDWPAVGISIARIRRLESEWELQFSPEHAAYLQKLDGLAAEYRARIKNQESFQVALGALRTFAERKNEQLLEKSNQSRLELESALQTLGDLWKQTESYALPISQEDLARFQGLTEFLQLRLRKRRDSDRLRRTFLILPPALLGVVLIAAGILYWRTRSHFQQLQEMQDGKMRQSANQVLEMMSRSAVGWFANLSPEWRARLESMRKWSQKKKAQLDEMEVNLEDLAKGVDGPMDEAKPEALMEKFAAALSQLKNLAADDAAPEAEKLKGLEGKLAKMMESLREQNLEKIKKALAGLEKLAAELDFEKPVAVNARTLAKLEGGLQVVEPLEHPSVPALAFPENVNDSLRKVRAAARLYGAEMTAWNQAKEAMQKADGFDAYRLALEQLSLLRFAECREAARVFASLSSEDATAAKLFFGGDTEAWQVARRQAEKGFAFVPGDGGADEWRRLAKLRSDPGLAGPGRKLLDAIQLPESPAAVKDGARVPPLVEVMDRVFRAPGDVVLKAYVAREVYAAMQGRSLDWGLHYSPELAKKMTELSVIVGTAPLRTTDWTRAEVRKQWQPKLQAFFQSGSQGRTFLELATTYRDLLRPAALGGVTYAGFVDEAKGGHFKHPPQVPTVLWGRSEQDQQPVAVTCQPVELPKPEAGAASGSDAAKDPAGTTPPAEGGKGAPPPSQPPQVLAEIQAWSPLLVIPVDPREVATRLTMR